MQLSQTLKRWYGLFGHWLNLKKQEAENKQLTDKLKNHTPILIYQMGKVGSSSIYWPLKKVYSGAVIHIHNFRKDHPAEEVRILHRFLHENPTTELKIISLVRDPIARNISAFFQNFERFVGCRAEDYQGSVQDLQAIFINKYHHHIPHEWFDQRLKRDFNIDIFNKKFSNSGFHQITNGHTKVLVLRQDLPDSTKEQLVREFTASPAFTISMMKNKASDKLYAEIYDSFKSMPLPTQYVEDQLTTKYTQHFFSADEISELKRKWV